MTGSDATPLVFPEQTEAGAAGVSYFGGNFTYVVPEPATWALLGAGLLLLELVRRARTR